ncbi:amino acid transporter [Acidihalobacter aeolianus]|uniref:Amino acid transporter n=2 Tax=Acidihalobacter aeolianus TaxID=2792603 RepID=A0A1D8KBQ6_9GAMM|nr:amino acid transporter [Acidihalobacter aeolianus]
MNLQLWLVFALTVFVLSMIPGPCMLLAATHGMHHGSRRTLVTTAGALSALVLMMLASAAGLGALFAASAPAFAAVKWAGAAYLVYLGVRTWRSGGQEGVGLRLAGEEGVRRSAWQRYRQGFAVAASNPKAIVFFGALFPQFIDPTRPQAVQYALLCATFVSIETAWQMAYAFGGMRLAAWFGDPGRLRTFNRLSGGMFVGLGVLLSTVHRS